MPRYPQSGSVSRPSIGSNLSRQVARPPQIQAVSPPTRQLVAPRMPQASRPLPQISGKSNGSRQAALSNPILQAPQKRATTGSANSAILPAKRDFTNQTGKAITGTRPMPLPGNREVVPGMIRNSPKALADPVTRNRITGTHPDVVRPGKSPIVGRHPDLTISGAKPGWNGSKARINSNFRISANWSTRRNDWGYSPWWNRSCYRPWYGSSWTGCWNQPYYASNYCYDRWSGGYLLPGYGIYNSYCPVGWGLLGWSLGSLIYDCGYRTYYNPYPVSVPVVAQGIDISYTEPISRIAAGTAPEDEAAVEAMTRSSESTIADSQVAFKQRNYLVALELADKAIAASPGDGALHEYRALILFALGNYADAAGVLNPVIASGPGWDWSTVIALYDTQDTYTGQLRKLEAWSKAKPGAADCHFLLGYHYMVCGRPDVATPQFELASRLMPADGVSKELLELTKATAKDSDPAPPAEADEVKPATTPVPLEKLTGAWVSTRDAGSNITLVFGDDGKFTWTYHNDGKVTELAGEFSLNDNGLLVLASKESQMIASVVLPADGEMKFVLTGGPPADPGLDFKKQ